MEETRDAITRGGGNEGDPRKANEAGRWTRGHVENSRVSAVFHISARHLASAFPPERGASSIKLRFDEE